MRPLKERRPSRYTSSGLLEALTLRTGSRCANTQPHTRGSGRANAPNRVLLFPSGVSQASPLVPQRAVHPQTGARCVPEGGWGVIPSMPASAGIEGVIPHPYFINTPLASSARHVGCKSISPARMDTPGETQCDWGTVGAHKCARGVRTDL